jgi:hypothetical protein
MHSKQKALIAPRGLVVPDKALSVIPFAVSGISLSFFSISSLVLIIIFLHIRDAAGGIGRKLCE